MKRKKSGRSLSGMVPRPWQRAEISWPEPSQKIRLILSQFAFGKIGDKYSVVIHDEPGVHAAPNLPENISKGRAHEKLAHFVLNWAIASLRNRLSYFVNS